MQKVGRLVLYLDTLKNDQPSAFSQEQLKTIHFPIPQYPDFKHIPKSICQTLRAVQTIKVTD